MNAYSICGYLWIVWYALWIAWAFQSKKTRERESIGSRLSYTLILFAAVWIGFFGRRFSGWWDSDIFQPPRGPDGWVWPSPRSASPSPSGPDSSSAATGAEPSPSRWTTNSSAPAHTNSCAIPSTVALWSQQCGTVIAQDHWRGVVALVLLWLGFTVKRLKEEQFMRQTFGAQYIDYARTTGAIFPRLVRRGF